MRNLNYFLYIFIACVIPVIVHSKKEKFITVQDRVPAGYHFNKKWKPEKFQGSRKKNNYFEGWYFKIVSKDGSLRYALIPGVSIGTDSHAFIQVINGSTGTTQYHRFGLQEFSFSTKRFAVKIGANFFCADSILVNIGQNEQHIEANMYHTDIKNYPVRFLSPGIMGWYRFVPRMECFHGVASLDHTINGRFIANADTLHLKDGIGYIEKDWGKSMPSAWVWTQSNSFVNNSDASFMLSVANIPWMGKSFTGFLGFFLHQNKVFRFATYTRAKITQFEHQDDFIHLTIKERLFTIEFTGKKGKKGELLAPKQGDMERKINESIDAQISVKVTNKKGELLFLDSANVAGLELVGDIKSLQNQ